MSEQSNGADSNDRLYVVDLIDREGSFFDPACCTEIGSPGFEFTWLHAAD